MQEHFAKVDLNQRPNNPCAAAKAAEEAFYDALARFGHESAEALVAEMQWRVSRKRLYEQTVFREPF